ncbi:MAG: neutral/alkaline non-lysosomal ceramidase N-terminal domain-containing protein [Leptospiraceae bacterium]|nr:neutral/alkaline non-lysosomal ceramidase N-terminal domain-containing protein [Leptospiraceae bacterium]
MKKPQQPGSYCAGWSKVEMRVEPRGHAMHGYGGMNENRAWGSRTPLFARALVVSDASGGNLIYCCLDLGVISYATRHEILLAVSTEMGGALNEETAIITCTHTHSAPGGLTYDAYYNLPTPGFQRETLSQVVQAASQAILSAWRDQKEVTLFTSEGAFADDVPVAWNRALDAYNRNGDVVKRPDSLAHLAINRTMYLLWVEYEGRVAALVSLFGVHATCIGNSGRQYCGDNKGFASAFTEAALAAQGIEKPIAIFAQTTAGDVSPHYRGPGEKARRARLAGEAEYEYAEQNGRLQSEHALDLISGKNRRQITGTIDGCLTYADFSQRKAAPCYADGAAEAETFEPCIGASMLAGKALDGAGIAPAVEAIARTAAETVRGIRLSMKRTYTPEERAYVERLYRAQGKKDIVIEGNHKLAFGLPLAKLPLPEFADPLIAQIKQQARSGAIDKSAMLPYVLPLQIVKMGDTAIVAAPGEFTTQAGYRLIDTIKEALQPAGIRHVFMNSYSNDYMGYVTTHEEYDQQTYEGGHNLYGKWTLAVFQTEYEKLSREFIKPPAERHYDREMRPPMPPAEELALRSNLTATVARR